MEDKGIIFKTLDNTPRMLFWDMDELLMVMVPFFIGGVLGSYLIMLSGFVIKKFYRRSKKRYPKGLLKHIIYWNIPTNVCIKAGIFKSLPHSHKRDFYS